MQRIPIRLNRDPIVEAMFEIRFEPARASLSDLLPGMLFPKFGDRFPNLERTPLSQLPREIQSQAPELKYQARTRLLNKQFILMLGDHSVTVSCLRPYIGWSGFRELILEVIAELHASKMISRLERYSIKYINLLPAQLTDYASQFAQVRFEGMLGSHPLNSRLTQVRTEIAIGDYLNVVELAAGTHVTTIHKENLDGQLLAIDTICEKNVETLWADPPSSIDRIRQAEKELFFDILSDAAADRFEAVWE